ncbi:GNAT family N-acetyltransferase [Chloroflexi bacterium TSY]|nr:GNAT family N-acetyltransferase [Chloroflexi bacterium TSY]
MQSISELSPPPHLSKYLWRHVQKSDSAAILDMMASAAEAGQAESVASEERIAALFDMLGERVVTDTRTALDDTGTIAALALIFFSPDEEQHVAMIDGEVHVDHRGLGLGGYILDWMETRVRQEHAKISDELPQLLRTSCAEHQTDQIALFESKGFEPVRHSYKMQRRLADPIAERPLPAGLRFVPWREELNLSLMHAFNDAFRGHWGLPRMNEELWHQFFTGVPQFRGDLTYLAMEEETIVGFCLNWVNESQNRQSGVLEGWIEAIGVIPDWRGRGVASSLMAKALNAFAAEGLEQVALDVDTQNPTGALRLYEKSGFQAAKTKITFVKNLKSDPSHKLYFLVKEKR